MSKDDRPILTRRDFVRGTASSVLAASVIGPAGLVPARAWTAGPDAGAEAEPAPPEQAEPARSRVVVVREAAVQDADKNIDQEVLGAMLATAVTRVTGTSTAAEAWAGLYRPEDSVGIVKSDFMNHTHGELIQLVLASLKSLGIPESHIHDAQRDNSLVESSTALLCMPALKAHWLTGIGTVLKNYIMFSGKPSAYHKADSEKLAEIWQMDHVVGKTQLTLVDALRPMCNKGPQPDPRYKWNYNGLVVGTDPVAVEAVCVKILEAKREAIKEEPWPLTPTPVCLTAADETYGLGTADLDKIDVELVGWEDEALI